MTRILDLQTLAAHLKPTDPGGESTSSISGCTCSTNSNTGCSLEGEFIAI